MDFTRHVIGDSYTDFGTYEGIKHEYVWSTVGTVTVLPGGSYTDLYSLKGFSDVEIENFHERRSRGEIFNNPFYKWEKNMSSSVTGEFDLLFSGWSVRPTWKSRLIGTAKPQDASDVTLTHHPDTIDLIDELKNKAVVKAWSRVHDESAAILASIAEGKDTINFIGNVLFRVVKILRALRRLDLRQVKNEITPMQYSKLYMEYRYALRPLAGEVQGALEAMNRVYSSPRMTRGWRETGSIPSNVTSATYAYGAVNSLYDLFAVQETTSSTRVSVGVGILFDVESTGANSWGLDQVVQTVWEVVPFSFIVDWFCNIADIISAHSPKLNTNVLANWCTVETVTTEIQRTTFSGQNTVRYGGFVNQAGLCREFKTPILTVLTEFKEKTRSPDPVVPWLPSWDINLDILKLLDLAIILKGFRNSFR